MESGVEFITHKSRRIVFINLANCAPESSLRIIEQAKQLVAAQPPKSVLTMTKVDGMHFNPQVAEAIKLLASHNEPYVKAGAVVGLSGMQRIIYDAVVKFTRRNLPAFSNVDEAKEWLVAQ